MRRALAVLAQFHSQMVNASPVLPPAVASFLPSSIWSSRLNTTKLNKCIQVVFSDAANPGNPVPLSKDAISKLATVPPLLRALDKRYGKKLEQPCIWGGVVHISFASDPDLFEVPDTLAADLLVTARKLEENAERQPPLPLAQAVPSPYCIDILHAVAQAHAKSGLCVSIEADGVATYIPRVSLSVFTEPEETVATARVLRSKVEGVCHPKDNANVLVLADMSWLELPFSNYDYSFDELCQMVGKDASVFVGMAESIGKNKLRALPGGQLNPLLNV